MSTNTIKKPVKAVANQIPISPRKVGEVVALVRGRTVEDARVILDHTPRRAAVQVRKVIDSAAANATNNHGLKEDGLYIDQIFVTTGARMKRYRIHGRGRINPFEKKTSHIHVYVDGVVKPVKKAKEKK